MVGDECLEDWEGDDGRTEGEGEEGLTKGVLEILKIGETRWL